MKYIFLIALLALSGCATSDISTKSFQEQLKEDKGQRAIQELNRQATWKQADQEMQQMTQKLGAAMRYDKK